MFSELPTHIAHSRVLGKGSPLIIFEAGCGAPSSEFDPVAKAVSQETKVLLYDRAGCGRSSSSSRTRDCAQLTRELRALLAARSLRPPYLLVAHSFGGLPARYFARRYRNEVAGLILLDVAHERMGEVLPPEYWAHEQRGIEHASEITRREAASVPHCARLLRSADGELGDLPLTVITAQNKFHDCPPSVSRTAVVTAWEELQVSLARASSRSLHVHAPKSGHSVHRDDPELVVREIRRMLRLIRSRPRAVARS